MGTAKHPRRSPLDAKKCGSAASAPQHVTTAGSLPQKQYEKQPQIDTFNRELLLKLNQLPGVQSVGLTSMLPSQGVNNNQTFFRRRIHSAT